MSTHRRREARWRRWPVILALIIAPVLVAGGRAALSRRPEDTPAAPSNVQKTSLSANSPESRDARTIAAELMALAAFETRAGDQGGRPLASAAGFLRDWQWDEERGCLPSHPDFGGTGRWPGSTPDLLHTALLLRAIKGAGVAADDPYVRKASIFIARCQIVDERWGGGDPRDLGGFSTRPVVHPTGETNAVRLVRPSGASTCLGLSSLLMTGAAPDGTRVRAALRWLEEHYSLAAHPGMARPREGLYGYYHEFARAMRALGRDRIRDSRGVLHDWRAELKRKLTEQQHADGSWTNPDESSEPAGRATSTITSLALLTLSQLRP